MCGYCIEKGMVHEFVKRCQTQAQTKESFNDGLDAIIILQECGDLIGFIGKLKKFDDAQHLIFVVFCRLYDQYITDGYNKLTYDAIKSVFSLEAINKFLNDHNEYHVNIWRQLQNQDIYEDILSWQRLIQSNKNCISQFEEILRAYCDWWLLGDENKLSDPSYALDGTTKIDPVENAINSELEPDLNKLYSIFPVVFFSFSMLKKFHPSSDIIRHIALENPRYCPFFDGYELWLQRKAFEFCIKEDGVEFMIDNFDKIRIELIAYVLLKGKLEIAELLKLREAILKKERILSKTLSFTFEKYSILELVDWSIDRNLNKLRKGRLNPSIGSE